MTKFRRSLTLHFGRNMTFFYAETGMYGMYAPLQVRHYWLGIKYVMGVPLHSHMVCRRFIMKETRYCDHCHRETEHTVEPGARRQSPAVVVY